MTDDNVLEGEIVDASAVEEEKTFSKRGIAKFVVRSSVKFVVAGAISNIVPEAETKIQKVKLFVGTYVIADMVARNTGTYVEEKIDGWKQDIQELREMIKKIESETPNS